MQEIEAKIKAIVEEFNRFYKEFQEKAQGALKEAFKAFFDANPTVKSIRWTQYTPYFNDGDECIFGRNEFFYSLTDSPEGDADEEEDGDWKYPSPYNRERTPEDEAVSAFEGLMAQIPNEVWEQTFGDHCQVIARREGFDTEEYEHE